MDFNWDRTLWKAKELEDNNLCVALQLAEGDERWKALLTPPLLKAGRNGTDVPLDDRCQQQVMCHDLYQASLSGSINRVAELLGLPEESRANIGSHDVRVLLEKSHDRKRSNKQYWGQRIHGDSFCRLQEVTAEKNTVLHIAAEQGFIEYAGWLIGRDNTLLTSQNSKKETPLHLAARAGNHRIISLIVRLSQESGIGAYEVLTKRSTAGDTVLHEAARHGHEDAVRALMTVAPALSAEVNNASMSPLYLAVVRKSVIVVKELLKFPHSSAVGPNQQNALHAAVLASKGNMNNGLTYHHRHSLYVKVYGASRYT